METKLQRLGAWCAAIYLGMFFVGWAGLGGYLPPPSPEAGATEIAAFYGQNTNILRAGLVLVQLSLIFYFPWIAVLSAQIKRIPGVSPVCTYTQLIGGVTGIVALILPYFFWVAASFRPERDPALMLLLNDLGWLILSMTIAPFAAQNLAVAFAIFSDKRPEPAFPRWFAYASLWVAFTFLPAGFILFFKSGPFSWRGLIGFWVPLGAFGVWTLCMMTLVLKAIKRQEMTGT